MKEFLTTHETTPPPISVFWYLMMVGLLGLLAWLTLRYHADRHYQKLFVGLQILQLLTLYGWYLAFRLPLADSLPLYHCRIAMLGLLFLPNGRAAKQYLALTGVIGSILALGYPVLDPYDFPHITGFSFLLGHYALFVNSLIYLLHHYQSNLLSPRQLIQATLFINAGLVAVNLLTGGNYGLLKHPPLMPDHLLWLNYLAVSAVLSLALVLLNQVCRSRRWLTLSGQSNRQAQEKKIKIM